MPERRDESRTTSDGGLLQLQLAETKILMRSGLVAEPTSIFAGPSSLGVLRVGFQIPPS